MILLIKILEVLFVAGWAGSLIVLLLTTIEDTYMLVEKDEPATTPQGQE